MDFNPALNFDENRVKNSATPKKARLKKKNMDPTIQKFFKNLLNKHKNVFTDKEFKYLNETDYNRSNFYGLPEIQRPDV